MGRKAKLKQFRKTHIEVLMGQGKMAEAYAYAVRLGGKSKKLAEAEAGSLKLTGYLKALSDWGLTLKKQAQDAVARGEYGDMRAAMHGEMMKGIKND